MSVRLTRDGETVATAEDVNAALVLLHEVQPHSWDHALAWEGWDIVDENGQSLVRKAKP